MASSPLEEASGYEIKKDIEEGLFSHFIDASFGSIYPALTQLAAEGLLTVRAEEQTGKPDKKVYAITEAGRAGAGARPSRWCRPRTNTSPNSCSRCCCSNSSVAGRRCWRRSTSS